MFALFVLLLLVLFSQSVHSSQPPPSTPLEASIVHSDLGFPNSFAIAGDGSVFVTSLAGDFVWRLYNGTKTPVYQFTNLSPLEGSGPLGIALDPDFSSTAFIYVYLSGEMINNQVKCSIYRFRITPQGTGVDKLLIFRVNSHPCSFEAGGKMAFARDGTLFLGVGNMMADYGPNASLSLPEMYHQVQDWSFHTGKIIRINRDGSFPKNNPHPLGIWAKGVRNVYGFAWDEETNDLWESEPGPDCNDEINRVPRDANLGWGKIFSCTKGHAPKNTNMNGKHIVMPKAFLNPVEAFGPRPPTPTGLQICNGDCKLGAAYVGKLMVGTFQPGMILTFDIVGPKRRRLNVPPETSFFNGAPVIAVERGPDGAIYFCDAAGFIKKLVLKA